MATDRPAAELDARSVEKYVRMARARAADCLPFFAEPLYAARLVVTSACPSLAAVDRRMRVYFQPEATARLVQQAGPRDAVDQLAWVWVHEISHVLRDHADRAVAHDADPTIWNVAADLEINDAQWEGLQPPVDYPPLLPRQFDLPEQLLAETYYDKLPKSPTAWVRRGLRNPLGDEGSGTHGRDRPWELNDEADDAGGLSSVELEALRENVVRQMQSSSSRGLVAGGWRRWLDRLSRPRIDWKRLLLRRLRGAVATTLGRRIDYSFARAHRRQDVYAPIVRPSLLGPNSPTIACVVDTSGSMSDGQLAGCVSEVRGVLDALRTPVTLIPCDAKAYEPIRLLAESDFASLGRKLPGGGGTNMVAGVDAALALKPRPDAVLVLTDGYTNYPPQPYDTPVIFAILPTKFQLQPPLPPIPPWRASDVIRIPAP